MRRGASKLEYMSSQIGIVLCRSMPDENKRIVQDLLYLPTDTKDRELVIGSPHVVQITSS